MPGEIDTLFSRKPEREIQIRIQISGVQLDDAKVFETSRTKQNCVNNQPFISLSEKYLDHLHFPAKEDTVLPSLLPYQSLHSLKGNFFYDSDSNQPSNTSSRDSENSSRKGEPCMSPSLSSHSSRQTQTIGYVANLASSSFKNIGASIHNPISKSCISKTPSGCLTCSRGTETFSRSGKSSLDHSKNQNSSIGASSILLSSNLQRSKCSVIASSSNSYCINKGQTLTAIPQIDKDSFSILGSFVHVENEEEKMTSRKPEEPTINESISSFISKQRSKSEGRKSLEKDDDIYKSSKSLSKRSSKHSSKHISKRNSKHRKESKFSLTIERISREKIDVALAMPRETTCAEEKAQLEEEKTEINYENQDTGMFDEQKQDLSIYAAQVDNNSKSKTSTYQRKSSVSEKQSGNVVSRVSTKDVSIRAPHYSFEKKCNTKEEYEKTAPLKFCCFNRKPASKNKPTKQNQAKGKSGKPSNQNENKGGCCGGSKKNQPKKRVWFRVCCCC